MTGNDDTQQRARDAVGRYLADRGVSAGVRSRGLSGIIAQWEAIARRAARYDLTLDDWLNDLDLRDIIAGALAVAPESEPRELHARMDRADDLFRAATVASAHSLWGTAGDVANGQDPVRQWWYFRRPAHPGQTMLADLATAGIT